MRSVAEDICRQFGNDSKDILKAFADTEMQEVDMMLEELPPPPAPEAIEEVAEVKVDEIADLMDKLTAIEENEESTEEDKTKATELKTRLEELQAAKQNAMEFVDAKAPKVEDEVVVEEETVASDVAPPQV
jgi:oligoendopeptidase F